MWSPPDLKDGEPFQVTSITQAGPGRSAAGTVMMTSRINLGYKGGIGPTYEYKDGLGPPMIEVLKAPASGSMWYTQSDLKVEDFRHRPGGKDHDQSTHAGGGGVSGLARMLSVPNGGFTYDGESGQLVTTGYAVGMSSSHPSTTMSADKFLSDPAAGKKMIADHLKAARDSGNKIGGWHDPDSGTIILDQVTVFPNTASGRRQAVALGRKEGEISIAHLDALAAKDYDNAFIPTGGSGNLDAADQRSTLPDHATDPAVRRGAHEAPLGDDRRGDRRHGRGDVRRGGDEGARPPKGDQRELIALLERIEARHARHNQKDHAGKGGRSAADDLVEAGFRRTTKREPPPFGGDDFQRDLAKTMMGAFAGGGKGKGNKKQRRKNKEMRKARDKIMKRLKEQAQGTAPITTTPTISLKEVFG